MSNKYMLRKYKIEELRKEADAGSAFSMYVLGHKYLYGDEVEADTDAGIDWLLKAYENGSPDGARALGTILFDGILLKKDCDQAVSLFDYAAQCGDAKAMHLLAVLYMYGECVEKNHHKAYRLMKSAYKGGHLLSGFFMINLIHGFRMGVVRYIFKYFIAIPVLVKWFYFNLISQIAENDRLWNLDMFSEVESLDSFRRIKKSYEDRYGPEML